MSRTDLELLARYASDRDAQAFAELVARHRDMVYAACYRILGSRAEAEDSAQDCFLALARSARSIKTSVAGWLHRVAVRHSLAIRRADRARRDREREAATMRPDDGTEPSWDDIESEVDRAIDALPDTLREPVVLHFLEGKPQTAIAEDLGISQPAVCMRIKKGLERLRKHFERNGLTLSAAAVAALLGAHASEAAPPTLLPSTGKMALAGITSGPAKGIVAGSALGRAAVICSKAKIACAVAASLVAAAVLQQTVLDTSVAGECPTTSRGLLRGATSGPTAATRPQMNQPPLGSEPAPPATPQGQAAAEPQPAVTTAQAAVQQPPTPAPRPPGMTLSLSPTGAITITDDEGLVATLWLIAFGTGWNPWDQRRHAEAALVADEEGSVHFAGEIAMLQDDGGTVLFEQQLHRTETGVEIEYDVTFDDEMTVKGLVLALRMPRERFAGQSLVLHAVDGQPQTIELPEKRGPFRLGTVEGERLDFAPDPGPLFTLGIGEPFPVRLAAQDLRTVHLDEYAVQIDLMSPRAGEKVLPGDQRSIRLWLDFPGEPGLGAVLPPECIVRPGVRLCREGRVDQSLCETVADVVSAAKRCVEGLLEYPSKEEIRVYALPAVTWHENIATNRRDAIYLRVGDDGLGEAWRADARPLGMLCQAVAELYNPRRVPGLDRFITHRHMVPAVRDAVGADVLPGRHPTPLADDGPDMLRLLTSDVYAPVHPDFAAAGALAAVEDRLEFETLRELLRRIPDGAPDPFAALRAAAVDADPTLAEAFAAYDRAATLEGDEDGACLIASFEPGDEIKRVEAHPLQSTTDDVVLLASPEFEMSQSDQWATHGTHSLRLHCDDPPAAIEVSIADPDWRFKDFRRFGAFEMDLMLVADEPQEVGVLLLDDVRGSHGQVAAFWGFVAPREPVHVSCPLMPGALVGQKHPQSECFRGPFRIGEVACIYVHLPEPKGPVTLFIDNLRLTPRAEGEGREGAP